MKNFIFLIVLLFIAAGIFSQAPSVRLSEQFDPASHTSITDIFASDNHFYAVNRWEYLNKAKITVDRLDNEFKITSSDELSLKADDKDLSFEKAFLLNGSIYIFGSYFNKKEDTKSLYSFNFKLPDMKWAGEPVLLTTLDGKLPGTFNFDISADENFISIMGIPAIDKNNLVSYTLNVFDNNMSEVWNDKSVRETKGEVKFPQYAKVSNQGNVLVFGTKCNQFPAFSNPGACEYAIILYNDKGVKTGSDKPDFSRNILRITSDYDFNDKGIIVCGGLYGAEINGKCIGIWAASIDPATGSIINETEKKLEDGVAEKFNVDLMPVYSMNGGYESSLIKGNFFQGEDGNTLLVLEKVKTSKSVQTAGSNTVNKYGYGYYDLEVVNINPGLEINWTAFIPKSQTTESDGGQYSSYTLASLNNMTYLIFNDNSKNADKLKYSDKITDLGETNSVVAMVAIDANAGMVKSILIDNKEDGFVLRPGLSERINNEIFINGKHLGKSKYGMIVF